MQGVSETTAPLPHIKLKTHKHKQQDIMPRLQAVVRPLTGKNGQKLPTPQVDCKAIAQLMHDFSPLSSIKISPACNSRQSSQ